MTYQDMHRKVMLANPTPHVHGGRGRGVNLHKGIFFTGN